MRGFKSLSIKVTIPGLFLSTSSSLRYSGICKIFYPSRLMLIYKYGYIFSGSTVTNKSYSSRSQSTVWVLPEKLGIGIVELSIGLNKKPSPVESTQTHFVPELFGKTYTIGF